MRKFHYCRHNGAETIEDFLARRFPYNNKEKWLKAVISGKIRVNGRPTLPGAVLRTKDVVSYTRSRSEEPEIDARYNILHEDESIVMVEKSGNIPVAESGQYYYNTLLNILKKREGYRELFAVHRLDKETSGALLIARKKKIAARLGEQFLRNIPDKTYHAILLGEFREESIVVEEPIKKGFPEKTGIIIRQTVDPQGKPAKTLFTAEKIAEGLTLARIKTYSGRTHQIRCHAEFIGHPILGDKLYGQSDDRFIDLLKGKTEPVFPPFGRISRQLLHASSLSFVHPESGEETTFVSDYKKEFSKHPFLTQWLRG